MTIIYIVILIAAAFIEVSDKCNTKHALKKIGLAFVMVGALLALAHRANDLIAVGVSLVLAAEIFICFQHKRRGDHANEHYS